MRHKSSLFLTLLFIILITILALSATVLAQPVEVSLDGSLPDQASQIADDVARLQTDSGGTAKVSRNQATGVASFVRLTEPGALAGDLPEAAGELPAEAKSAAFFNQYGGVFGISNPRAQLNLQGAKTDNHGQTRLKYQQIYKGVEVFAGIMRTHFNKAGQITAVNGTFVPDLDLSVVPGRSSAAATTVAIETVASQNGVSAISAELSAVNSKLLVFRTGLVQGVPGSNHLAYEVEVANGPQSIREFVYVDAHTGKVLDQITGIHEELDRKVSETSLSNVIWEDSAGDTDPITAGWAGGSVQQVTDWQNEIDGARETYNLFASMTGGTYLSYDAADATMRTVNNDPGILCPNATWNGVSTNYCSNVTGDDTVAHEWGHAYTEYTNNLIYQWQSGALNESYSDIWGEVVDLVNGRGLDAPDLVRSSGYCSSNGEGANFPGNPTLDTMRWLSGEDDPAFNNIPFGSGNAIRDMWDPTCFGDPGKVSDNEYYCSSADAGGVHSNSGVPNRAFALLVDGDGQTVSGIGLTKAAHIHWAAQNMLTPASNFQDHADALEQACSTLIGTALNGLSTSSPGGVPSGESITQADCDQVSAAVNAVEFRTPPSQCNFTTLLDPNAPALCSAGGTVNTIDLQDFEAGLAGWNVGTRDVANQATFDTPDWAAVGNLPAGSPAGSAQAAFVNNLNIGDCGEDNESGVLYMDSPVISIPTGTSPRLAFDHWVASELNYDGGNLKASVNGGPFNLVPTSAFSFNPYNKNLAFSLSTNPLAGQPAFTGKDDGFVGGSWGQSQVDLSGIADPGDEVVLRYEFGIDGCVGQVGWYVDNVHTYSCDGPQIYGTVSGTVTDNSSGSPVGGAVVSSNTGQSDTTDSSGSYSLANVPAGQRTITASMSGYATQQQVTNVTDGGVSTVDFALDPLTVPDAVHVGDLDSSSIPAPRNRWDAMVTFTIHGNLEEDVSGAIVEGNWSHSVNSSSCTTDASGQCSVTLANLKGNVDSVLFTVSNVTSSAGAYDGRANHDPDSDSNGTTIVVYKDGPPPDQPPTADNKSESTDVDTNLDIALTATDPEACELNFSIVSPPVNGDLSPSLTNQVCLSGSPNSDSVLVTYAPDAGFQGFDSITYKANDGGADSNIATVFLTVGTPTITDPVVNGCDPGSGTPGDRFSVTVMGSNFQNGATADFGPRVTVQNLTVDSTTQLTVQIRIHNRAAGSSRDVTVTNPDGGSGVGGACFTVN